MKVSKIKLSAIASGVALGIASAASQAAQPPAFALTGPKTGAEIQIGGTLNNRASYQAVMPAADSFDIVATIKPESADVGKSGSLVVALEVEGLGTFNLLSGGIWVPLDLANIQAYKTKTLTASEDITILDNFIGTDTNLTGTTLKVYVAYYTDGDISNITYNTTAAAVAISTTPSGCPTGTTANSATYNGLPVCNLPVGDPITTDMHLTANNAYFFSGTVFVGNNTVNTPFADKVSLTIDPGVNIISEGGQSALVVSRGGKIFANGSPDKPIIMTSSQDDGSLDVLNARGLWGGVAINGSATQNTASGYAQGEGFTGEYGGGTSPNDSDNSGSMTYVQIRYAGYPITADDELNTISLHAVGSGTTLDYIHSHNGADDGIEFYGGTVNAKHILITGQDDDALDWTNGWTGNLQHVVIKHTTSGDNCIEADNLGANPIATPRSNPTISNLTCITSSTQKSSGHAFELKAGTAMQMYNSVVGGVIESTEGCILIAGDETFSQSGSSAATLNGTLKMERSYITTACAAALAGSGTFTTAEWFAAQAGTTSGSVDLGGPNGWTNGSLINAKTVTSGLGTFFDTVDHIGGVKDDTSDWTKGWSYDYD
ncbi:MAG: hypothetical protein QF916_06115 [Gammaproteobacteria bacterium]|nr:hypothetical protein [Gammaproteobacteria bacterium]